MIWKIWKKSVLKSKKIWKIWRKSKFNSENTEEYNGKKWIIWKKGL